MLDSDAEENRISTVGLLARSPEGHAAKGMQIKGNEDVWIEIQAHTFRNWVNEHLRPLGLSVEDLTTDLCDGTRLIALVEALQKRTLRKIHKPVNQHQMLENVTRALDAIASDGVKLVNIGNVDIVNGNLKLILGLIWSLIVRYQIGRSKFPPKKLMLAWLRAVLPGVDISNFTSDWNSGVRLSALVDYCRPGSIPNWKNLNPKDGIRNCRVAMDIAKKELGVPIVLDPEYLASPHLDELSGMTYISYFMRENGPGYRSTLNWVRNQLPQHHISNFTTDWNNGELLCELVRSYGGPVPGMDNMSTDPEHWESNLSLGMKGGEKLGVSSLLRPKDMADPSVDHLGVMAYTSQFQWLPSRPPPGQRVTVSWESRAFRKSDPITFHVEINEEQDHLPIGVSGHDITIEVKGPSGKVDCKLNHNSKGAITKGTFFASEIGIHEVIVKYQGEPVVGSPLKCRVLPQYSEISHTTGLAPCSVGSVVEVLVNPQDTSPSGAKLEFLEVVAVSPSGAKKPCMVNRVEDIGFAATFKPDESGEWKVIVLYKGKDIQGSPFPCFVYDPNGVVLDTLEGALPGLPFAFICDARGTGGLGDVAIDVTHEGRSIPYNTEYIADGVKRILLPVLNAGKHRVHVYFNGREIKGSPFSLRVGSSRSRRKNKEGSPGAMQGKTRSFDKDESFGILKNSSMTSHLNNSSTTTSTTSALHNQHFTNLLNKTLSGHQQHPSPSPAFDTSTSSNRTTSTNKYDSFEMNKDHHHRSINNNHDNVDAVHSRLRFSSPPPPVSPNTKSGDLFSSKFGRISNSIENLSSIQAIKNLSNSTRQHHNQSLMHESSLSAKATNTSSSSAHTTFQEQIRESRQYQQQQQQQHYTTSASNFNGIEQHHPQPNGNHHGDIVVDGDGLGVVLINSLVTVTVSSEFGNTSLENINVEVSGPSGRLPVRQVGTDRSVSAKYTPVEVGEHLIHIELGQRPIEGSPFRAAVFNPKAIKVGRVPNGVVGRPVEIDIQGYGAGMGHLNIVVDGGRVTSEVKALGDHRFKAIFVPFEKGDHYVEMSFNQCSVPGSPWRVNVSDKADGLTDSIMDSARQQESSDVVMIRGDPVRHVRFGKNAVFEINAPGFTREAVDVSVLNPSKKPISYRLLEEGNGQFMLEFNPSSEIGTYLAVVDVAGKRMSAVAKVYNPSLIRVLDVTPGIVGQTSQFKVDAKDAGEGQLEISINDGELPNQVRVLGGGCCLVSFTPEIPKEHLISIKFNGETIGQCPIICQVADTRQVAVSLSGLELIPVHQVSRFQIAVDGSSSAELAVSVKGPSGDLPVKVSGSVRSGFTAEFSPQTVGPHTIEVFRNSVRCDGTPFIAKAYDAKRVYVSPVPRGALGRSIQFTVDASQAGEGNLEITIAAKGCNVPTQVHPQGGARFQVSFVPLVPNCNYDVSVTFNKEPVPGSPFVATVSADPGQVVVTGPSLAATPVGKTAHFSLNNVHSALDDVEVAVEGPGNAAIPAQISEKAKNSYGVEFKPLLPGEHRISISIKGTPVPGSPFSCKVYDVGAIKVRDTERGIVGKPVTFLVETSKAGPGNLEVTVNGGSVPTSATAQGSHTYAISFVPKQEMRHMIELRFNSDQIPGSPFICEVVDASKVNISGEGLEKVPVGRRATFMIEPEVSLGTPEVKITGPLKKIVHSSIQMPSDNRYLVEYVPIDVGDHTVEISLPGGVTVPGSPYLVKAYDASKVRVTDISPGFRGKPVYFGIDASGAGAGNLEIIVSVGGRNVPNYVQAEGNAKFRVNFKPQEASLHLISVRFNSLSVTGSPFECKITDTEKVLISGSALKSAAANQPATITIDPQGAEVSTCNVLVLSPSAIHLPINLTGSLPDKIAATFTPTEVGPHNISVVLDGEAQNFTCNVYNADRVKIAGLKDGHVGEPITFTVDASAAGEGTLELVVTTGKQSLRAEVTARSRGLYDVTFVPLEPTRHFVNITFCDLDVPGSPFECAIEESYSTINGVSGLELESISDSSMIQQGIVASGLEAVIAGTTAFIDLEKRGPENPDVTVIGPDGTNTIRVRTRQLQSGYTRCEFTPDRVGIYEISVSEGSKALLLPQPLKARVFDPLLVRIREKSETAVLGQDYSFKVDISKSGLDVESDDAIDVKIKTGLGDVRCNRRNMGNGVFLINFKPVLPLTHRIHVLCNGFNAKGCPFDLIVADNGVHSKDTVASGPGLYLARCGRSAGFTILTKGSSGRDFDVVVSGPGGVAVPVRCYQQRDGNLRAEFTPNLPGTHEVAVYHRSKMVKNSPFVCHVYDPQKVLIGSIPTTLTVGQSIILPVDVSQAGDALLESDVTGPEGLPKPLFPYSDDKHGENVLMFLPKRPGKYKIMLNYGGEPVPGCPIVIQAEEAGAAKAAGPGLNYAHVGVPAIFQIFGPGLPGVPSITVEGPESVAKSEVKRVAGEKDAFQATYLPTETGVFDVRVTWAGIDIPGSPFHPRVVDGSKLRVIGGWDAHCSTSTNDDPLVDQAIQLAIGEERKIAFNTVDGGPGTLSIDGDDVLDFARIETGLAGRCKLVLTPMKAGEYFLNLKWGHFDIENAPKRIVVHSAPAGDYDGPVVLSGAGLVSARCGEEAYFTIDASQAGLGPAQVSLHSSDVDVPITVTPVGGGVYKAVYIPRVPGSYQLNVTWGGKPVPNCPMTVNIGAIGDASKVICTGDGLRAGTVGKDIRSFIDTRRSGPGELTAQCVGPRKTAYCELYDHGDGTFTLNIRPQEPGKHLLSIKYSGEHVVGSPFNLKVVGLPDASQVKVYGPGIEHGVLATFQSRFICDTRGAGAGQLTVRVRGPKGAFRVEMQRESQKDRKILCKYDPTEPEQYRVEVRWAGEHVPGSPFQVMIFDTQEELHQFVQQGTSPGPTQSEFYGSTNFSMGQMSWRGSMPKLN